jgi:phosphoglycolate phosphatase
MKLIVFDFDGTLVDSRRLIIESHRVIFAEFGLPLPSEERSLALIGKSLEIVLAELAGPEAPVQGMAAAYGRLLPQLRASAAFAEAPFDGMHALLIELAARPDIVLGIATGHVAMAVMPALERFGWRDFFATIQTADMAPSKPHPGMLLQALRATGVTPEDAVFIGDTSFDMEMARAARFDAIGVAWGYHPAERLTASGARRIVRTSAELRACFLSEGA